MMASAASEQFDPFGLRSKIGGAAPDADTGNDAAFGSTKEGGRIAGVPRSPSSSSSSSSHRNHRLDPPRGGTVARHPASHNCKKDESWVSHATATSSSNSKSLSQHSFDPFEDTRAPGGAVNKQQQCSPKNQLSASPPLLPRPPTSPLRRQVSAGRTSEADDDAGAKSLTPPEVNRISRHGSKTSSNNASANSAANAFIDITTTGSNMTTSTGTGSVAHQIPPKLMVKLSIHEEVSSIANPNPHPGFEGSSVVFVEGTVYAQVQCSDGKKNAPFLLHYPRNDVILKDDGGSDSQHLNELVRRYRNLVFRPDRKHSIAVPDGASMASGKADNHAANATTLPASVLVCSIPKQVLGFVPVAYYSFTEDIVHMPLLLERKVTFTDSMCRIAVQVRSKLSNAGDLEDFTIAVAVPEHMDGDSIQILRGDGIWDGLKRVIKWRLPSLNKGESFMVSAQGKFWKRYEGHEDIAFPVLLRCSAPSDQITTVDFTTGQAEGYPASVTTTKVSAFRLLHRLT